MDTQTSPEVAVLTAMSFAVVDEPRVAAAVVKDTPKVLDK